jgi:hypothetical protein
VFLFRIFPVPFAEGARVWLGVESDREVALEASVAVADDVGDIGEDFADDVSDSDKRAFTGGSVVSGGSS